MLRSEQTRCERRSVVLVAYFWAKAAAVAAQSLAEGDADEAFYQSKIYTAQYFFQRLLPRTESLKTTMLSGVENVLDEAVNPFV